MTIELIGGADDGKVLEIEVEGPIFYLSRAASGGASVLGAISPVQAPSGEIETYRIDRSRFRRVDTPGFEGMAAYPALLVEAGS